MIDALRKPTVDAVEHCPTDTGASTLYTIHGIRKIKPEGVGPGLLKPYATARGWDCRVIRYGYVFFVGSLYMNGRIAGVIHQTMLEGCTIAGHSNGCAIAARIAQLNPQKWIAHLVMINPALDVDWIAPDNVGRVTVLYNRADQPTLAARYIPWHEWGAAGRYGLKNLRPQDRNIDTEKIAGDLGHSAVLTPERVSQFWGDWMFDNVFTGG